MTLIVYYIPLVVWIPARGGRRLPNEPNFIVKASCIISYIIEKVKFGGVGSPILSRGANDYFEGGDQFGGVRTEALT